MNTKDFETVALRCEATLARLCDRYMPLHNSSDYSINSDRYDAAVNALYFITEHAMNESTMISFVLCIESQLERCKNFSDIYYREMHFFCEDAHDYEYYKTYALILRKVLNTLYI